MTLPVTAKVAFGGDYNPEQVWKQDYRLFNAARIDTVTVGVFTWALTQPAEDVYDFSTLDRVTPDGTRLLFLLNHRAEPVEVTAHTGGDDLLTGDRVEPDQPLALGPRGVTVLRQPR